MHRRLLFHVHTHHSADGWISPRQIAEYAKANGIGMVIVTDHDTHLGASSCAALNLEGTVKFPLSAEYRSSNGDMISTFLSRPIRSRDPLGIIDETHDQGGLVILPHPFRGSRFSDKVFERADLIETFNARCSDDQNSRAADTAQALSKPGIAGADAHLFSELGLAVNDFEPNDSDDWRSMMLTSHRTFAITKTTVRAIRISQMLKAGRQMRPIIFAKNLVRWAQASPSETP